MRPFCKKHLTPGTLLFLTIIGSAIRLFNLSNILFYWDEPIHTVRVAYQPLSYVLAHNVYSALFSILVHLLLPLGKIELMSRIPSFIAGVLLIPVIYLLGKSFFSKKEGLVLAGLVAFSPTFIRFSQYSRTYSVLILFSVLTLYSFFRAINEDKVRFWVLYSLFGLFSVYSHLMAFFSLTGISLYMAIVWIQGILKKSSRKEETKKFMRFALATTAFLLASALLYSQDITVRNFLGASIERVQSQTPIYNIALYLIKKIFTGQMWAKGSFLFLMLFSLLLGFFGCIRREKSKALLMLLYIGVPFSLFLAVKPRTVHIQSAERYFSFFIPIFFLLIARGAVILSSGIYKVFRKPRSSPLVKSLLARIVLVLFTGILIFGFNHKHFYLSFWRFRALPIEKETREYLQENVKKDSLFFLEPSPASGYFLLVNPLTKKISLNGDEALIRENFQAPLDKNPIMIFCEPSGDLINLAQKKADLWAAAKLDLTSQERLAHLTSNSSGVSVTHLKNLTFLHFHQKEEIAVQKLSHLAETLLSLDRDPFKAKELHLLAAKVYLIAGQVQDAYSHLELSQKIDLQHTNKEIFPSSLVYKFMDRLFSLSQEELRTLYFNWFYHREISDLLFLKGEEYFQQRKFSNAYQAYIHCLDFSKDHNQKISNQFFQLANNFLANKVPDKAIPIYRKAIQLNPERFALKLFLAEAVKISGDAPLAEKMFQEIFDLRLFSKETLSKIMYQDPLVVIAERDSSWRLIFRGKKGHIFSGKIVSDKNIDNVQETRLSSKDTLSYSKTRASFSILMDKRRMKIIEFKVSSWHQMTFDIRVEGSLDPSKIIIVNSGKSPDQIPFVIKKK